MRRLLHGGLSVCVLFVALHSCDGQASTNIPEEDPAFHPILKYGVNIDELVGTTPDLVDYLNIANDVNDIKKSTDTTSAKSIYSEGHNTSFSLKHLSVDMASEMMDERTYNLYRHFYKSLVGRDEEYESENIDIYADDVVDDLFEMDEVELAAEATVILHIWMSVVHQLELSVLQCKNSGDLKLEDPMPTGISALNRALAFWIGQTDENDPLGSSLYGMTESLKSKFERTAVNRDFIKLWTKAKHDYFLNDHCFDDPTAWLRLRSLKNEMISKMTIPLLQYLIDYIITDQKDHVALYTTAVAPLISGCSPSTADYFIKNAILDEYRPELKDEFISHLQSMYSCLRISCADVGEYKNSNVKCIESDTPKNYVGFMPYNEVDEAARIDLDILQMRMFLEVGAIETTRDLYLYGHNSLKCSSNCAYNSLYEFTLEDSSHVVEQYQAFTMFYGKENYLDRMMTTALDDAKIFETNNQYERSSMMIPSIAQYMIMYMRPLQFIYSSLHQCEIGDFEASLDDWNLAAANLLGSLLDMNLAEYTSNEGTLVYSILKKTCEVFDTCYYVDPSLQTSLGSVLNDGNEYAKSGECATLKSSVQIVVSILQVALVQSTIYYAMILSNNSSTLELDAAYGIVSAMSVVPLVAVGEKLSADKLETMIKEPENIDKDLIIKAFKRAVPIMIGLNCEDVGTLEEYGGFCIGDESPDLANVQDDEINLSTSDGLGVKQNFTDKNKTGLQDNDFSQEFPFNRYPVSTDTWEISRIALDVREMKNSANASDAYWIYTDGSGMLTLESMSINATDDMQGEVIFNVYRDALDDYFWIPEWYADELTRNEFNSSQAMFIEASVVLNVWMYTIHVLNNAVKDCEIDISVVESLDVAFSMWVGFEQEEGSTNGHLLYSIAEIAENDFFGVGASQNEAKVNTKLIELFNEARTYLSPDGTCKEEKKSNLRMTVSSMQSTMMIPLIQQLIHHLNQRKEEYVLLYAFSIVPMIRGCNPDSYDILSSLFDLEYGYYELTDIEEFISALENSYSCLRIACDDVGKYVGSEHSEITCNDEIYSMAGFMPPYDSRENAKIDLDVLQMSILLKYEEIEAAEDIYRNGRNSYLDKDGSFQSLYRIAQDYVESFETDLFDRVYSGLNFPLWTFSQLSDLVVSASQTFLGLRVVPKLLEEVQSLCVDGEEDASGQKLAEAGAYLIGSMEGYNRGGSESLSGILIYDLGKKMCEEFGTCAASGDAIVNERLIDLLKQVQDGISEKCVPAYFYTEILKNVFVPIIQAILYHSSWMQGVVPSSTNSTSISSLYTFSHAIIPFMSEISTVNAIKVYLIEPIDSDSPILPNGFTEILDLLNEELKQLGITCNDIGKTGQVDLCSAIIDESSEIERSNPMDDLEDTSSVDNVAQGFPFNRYPVSTDTWEISRIALDVREMKNSANASDAYWIYTDGSGMLTLESMSINATDDMQGEVIFNVYRDALDDYFWIPEWYADELTRNEFNSSQAMFIEASVVLNVWMYTIHVLNNAVKDCEIDISVVESLDVAFSMWVGFEQEEGSTNGHLLYSIAEIAENDFFGVGASQNEAKVNTKLIELFNEARTYLSPDGTCKEEKKSNLRMTVSSMQSTMMIPLIQQLIHHLNQRKEEYVLLYAFSIVPMIRGCNPDSYDILSSLLDLEYGYYEYELTDIEEFISALENSYSCLRIACDDVGKYVGSEHSEITCNDEIYSMAGFMPPYDSRENAKIDLDVLQMSILLKYEEIEAAEDIYRNGRNSYLDKDGSFQSLYGIAQDYVESFETDLLDHIFDGRLPITISSQLSDLVISTSQTIFSLLVVPEMLEEVQSLCVHGEEDASGQKLAEAGAYLIGSMEGYNRGGSESLSGILIYDLGKKMCEEFGTCAASGDALVNERLIDLLKQVQDGISERCANVHDAFRDIHIIVFIPMIQAILYHSSWMQGVVPSSTNSTSISSLYAFSHAIHPFIINSTAAEVFNKALIQPIENDSPILPNGSIEIVEVLKEQISKMGIPCDDVGKIVDGDLCSGSPQTTTNIDVSDTTSLSNGLYITTTNVGDRHKIAKDVKDMENALKSGDSDLAQLIYNEGLNAWKYDDNGKRTNKKWTLREYSTTAAVQMREDPVYNMYLYALRDSSGNFLNKDVTLYADSFVSNAFSKRTLASEAVVVLNLWMTVVHKIYAAFRDCKENIPSEGVHVLDEAVAYWIGDDQITGFAYGGSLLYSLSEEMGVNFNQDGESEVNRKVLRLFNEAKDLVTFPDACTEDSQTDVKLKHKADELLSAMTIPLLQGLLHKMYLKDVDGTKLYAIAVLPLFAGCNPETFASLHEELIVGDYTSSKFDKILKLLQSGYSCLGITCDDVGYYYAGPPYTCEDPPEFNPMASYAPSTDVREHAKLDLDILQMNILLDMNALEAAEALYLMGKNSRDGENRLSLKFLASNPSRNNVPQYSIYDQYFDDEDYADTIIVRALNKKVPYDDISVDMRSAIVVDTLKSMVIHMHFLSLMYKAINDCMTNTQRVPNTWDEAAAIFIGSLEGPTLYGKTKHPGQFLFRLGQSLCAQFGTCDSDSISKVNSEILELMYSGQSELAAGKCKDLERTVSQIESLIQVPLIQSTLKYALINDETEFSSFGASYGSGYVYSKSILPIVKAANELSASIIEKNMDFRGPILDGAVSIFDAFASAIPKMNGVDCRDVGKSNQMSVCGSMSKNLTSVFGGFRNANMLALAIAVPISFMSLLVFVYLCYGNQRKAPEKVEDLTFDTSHQIADREII